MNSPQVDTLGPAQIELLKPLVARCRYGPYRFLSSDLERAINTYWLSEMSRITESETGAVLAVTSGSEAVGAAILDVLPWDSRVIGYRMAGLKYLLANPDCQHMGDILDQLVLAVEEWALSHDTEFILCRVYCNDIQAVHALERAGFLLMDTLLDYVYDFRAHPLDAIPRPKLCEGASVRLAEQDDVEELAAVAREAFRHHFGRIHADPRIDKDRATRFYEEWIRSSCEGYGDWIVITEVEGRIAGLSVWRKPSSEESGCGLKVGHYSIGAIHPSHHGRGLFTAITYAGMEMLAGHADYVVGPTHVCNQPVQRGYARLGWRIGDARHSFHKWPRE